MAWHIFANNEKTVGNAAKLYVLGPCNDLPLCTQTRNSRPLDSGAINGGGIVCFLGLRLIQNVPCSFPLWQDGSHDGSRHMAELYRTRLHSCTKNVNTGQKWWGYMARATWVHIGWLSEHLTTTMSLNNYEPKQSRHYTAPFLPPPFPNLLPLRCFSPSYIHRLRHKEARQQNQLNVRKPAKLKTIDS